MKNRIANTTVRETTPIRLGDRYATCERYGIGYSTLIVWARSAGAIVRFGRAVRFDWTVLDRAVDKMLNTTA